MSPSTSIDIGWGNEDGGRDNGLFISEFYIEYEFRPPAKKKHTHQIHRLLAQGTTLSQFGCHFDFGS